MPKLFIGIGLLVIIFSPKAIAAIWYPPASQTNPKITSPADFLGYPLDQWHLRSDQINYYLKTLAQQSARVSIESTGQSHQQRAQLSLIISAPKNQQKLAQIRQQRQLVKKGKNLDTPLIIWLAYAIHGDEASGANTSLALAYYLSSSNETWVKTLLEQAIILITPSQNPDGLDYFTNWVNRHRGRVPVALAASLEHQQSWPTGRFNHYLADLNRDWLALVHPETQARVALFHRWQPHLVADFHEMAPHLNYFFQPGVSSRTHRLTPKKNQQLTEKLASYHQNALDKHHQAYFSKQIFDDFFYGKGASYPDINGSIGILFEQGSALGKTLSLKQKNISFNETIENHFVTSISSLKGALALSDELKSYQTEFFANTQITTETRLRGWLINAANDNARRNSFAKLLAQHQIHFFYLAEAITAKSKKFLPNDSLFIPKKQPQQRLVKALFDEIKHKEGSIFYDVSSFNMQHAWGLNLIADKRINRSQLASIPQFMPPLQQSEQAIAYLIDWRNHQSPELLQALLELNLKIKVATSEFTTSDTKTFWSSGTLLVPAKQATIDEEALKKLLIKLANQYLVPIASTKSFATIQGADLGSADFKILGKVKPLILTGDMTEPTAIGQNWYFLDKQLGIETPLINIEQLEQLDLRRFTHILLADGSYHVPLTAKAQHNLKYFVEFGGTIITQERSIYWLQQHGLIKTPLINKAQLMRLFAKQPQDYKKRQTYYAQQQITGAIVQLELDLSHPISFGINKQDIALMKTNPLVFSQQLPGFNQPVKYADSVLLAGYLAQQYQAMFATKPAIVIEPRGKGQIIAFTDNLLFRNNWKIGEKLFANALFIVPGSLR